MSINTQLKIEDYFARAGMTGSKGLMANKGQNSIQGDFNRILNGLPPSSPADAPTGQTGLRINNYLENPIRTRTQRTIQPQLADPDVAATNTIKGDRTGAEPSSSQPDKTMEKERIANAAGIEIPKKKSANEDLPESVSELSSQIDVSVKKAARKYNLPAQLIRSVIQAESNFRPEAVSPAGAQGLMQLMPGTARELGVIDPFDVDQNIDGGARYLRKMMDMFDGDLKQALSAYNAGPGTVLRYKGNVPYHETRNYVKKVIAMSRRQENISTL